MRAWLALLIALGLTGPAAVDAAPRKPAAAKKSARKAPAKKKVAAKKKPVAKKAAKKTSKPRRVEKHAMP